MAADKSSGWLIAAALACVMCLQAAPAFAVTDADRVAVYKEFRTQFDAKQYAEAQPLAERLVALTEEQYGAEELALTNPLTNLATVHYKLGNYPAAIENYQRTLRILQAKSTIADRQQIRPLHGLGVSFLGANDPESAVVALKRAADLSRNTDGLFNINQVEFIDALIDAYAAHRPLRRSGEGKPVRACASRKPPTAATRSSCSTASTSSRAGMKASAATPANATSTSARSASCAQGRAGTICVASVRCAASRARSGSKRSTAWKARTAAPRFNSGNNGAPVFSDGTQQRRGESALTTALDIIDAQLARRRADARRGAHRSRRLVPDRRTRCAAPTTPMPKPGRRSTQRVRHQAARGAARARLSAVGQLGRSLAARSGRSRGQGRGDAFHGGSRRADRRT